MNINTIVVGPLETNCYIITIANKALIIDPGDEENKIIAFIKKENLMPVGIIITHNHNDHTGAVSTLKEMYEINAYDYNTLFEQKHFLDPFKFQVIYTPGHHDTCITLYFYEYECMFTGDFLFKEDIGRTDLENGSYEKMLNSINKIKQYDDAIKVYPGHGESTTLGYEKQHNSYFN